MMITLSILLLFTNYIVQGAAYQHAVDPRSQPLTPNRLQSRFLSLGDSFHRGASYSTTPTHKEHGDAIHERLFHAVEHCSKHGCQLTIAIECNKGETKPQVVKVTPFHKEDYRRHAFPRHHEQEPGHPLPPWIIQQRRNVMARHPPYPRAEEGRRWHERRPLQESFDEDFRCREPSPFRHHLRSFLHSRAQPQGHPKSRHEHLWLGDEEDYHRHKKSYPKHQRCSDEEREFRHHKARRPSSRWLEELEEERPKHGKHPHKKLKQFFESSEEEAERHERHRHKGPKHRVEASDYEDERRARPHHKHKHFRSEGEEERGRHPQKTHKRFDPHHVVTRDKYGDVILEPRHKHHEHPRHDHGDKDKKHRVTFPDGNIAIINATDLKDPKWWKEVQKRIGKSGTVIINPIIIGTETERERQLRRERGTRTVNAVPGLVPRHFQEQRRPHPQEYAGIHRGRRDVPWVQTAGLGQNWGTLPTSPFQRQPHWNYPKAAGAGPWNTALPRGAEPWNIAPPTGTSPWNTAQPTNAGPWNTAMPVSNTPWNTAQPMSNAPWNTTPPTGTSPWNTAQPISNAPWNTAQPVSNVPWNTASPVSNAPWNTAQPISNAPWNTAMPTGNVPWNTAPPTNAGPWNAASPTNYPGIPVSRVLPEHQQHHHTQPSNYPGQHPLAQQLEAQVRRIADQEIAIQKHNDALAQPQGLELGPLAHQHAQEQALSQLALEKHQAEERAKAKERARQEMQMELEVQARQLHSIKHLEDERAQRQAAALAEQAKHEAERQAQHLIEQARQKAAQEAERQRIQQEAQRRVAEGAERIKIAAEEAIKHQLQQDEANKRKQMEAAKKGKKWKPGKYFNMAKEKLEKQLTGK